MAQVNFRMSSERLALIDRAAAIRGVTRTEFVLRSSEAAAIRDRGPARTVTCSMPPHGPTATPTPAPGATNAASIAIERGGANVIATRSRRAHSNETKPDATDGAVPAGGGEPPDRSPYSPPRVTVVQIPTRPAWAR